MAKAEVTALLNEIIANISKKTSEGKDAYRKFKSDKKVHKIHLSVKETQLQVEKEMYFREGIEKHGKTESRVTGAKHSDKSLKLLDKIIKDESEKLVHAFHKKFSLNRGKRYYASELGKNKNDFTFVYAVIPGKETVDGKTFNVFDNFKEIKQTLQKPMINALNAWARDNSVRDTSQVESKRKDKKYKGRKDTPGVSYKDGTKITMVSKEIKAQGAGFLDIGHAEGSSVAAQKALDASEKLWELDANFSGNKIAKKFLKEMQAELTWFVKKTDKKGKLSDQVEIGLESKAFNRDVESKKEALKLEAQLQTLLADLGADRWADFGGSDSMREKIEKTVLNRLYKSVKGGKGIRTRNLKHQKIKYSDAKYKAKPIIPKIKKAVLAISQARTVKKPKRIRAKRAGPSNVPLYLIGVINKDLPNVVEGNMGPPRLTSQTGRFADSTRVTDMTSTSQGFPSIGYTYQRDPYGVFEQDSDYDPRKLIDRSIREIAAEYAIGRFYTRRV